MGEGDGDQSSVASAPKTPEPGGAGNRATDGRQPETARAWAGGVSRASRKWWRWGSTPRPLSGLGSAGGSAEKRQLHSHVLLGGSRAGAGASSPTPASEQAGRAGCVRHSVVPCALGDGSARSSPVGASLCHGGGGGGVRLTSQGRRGKIKVQGAWEMECSQQLCAQYMKDTPDTRVQAHAHTCTHMCEHTRVYTHVQAHAHTCICMHTCASTHLCTHVHMHAHMCEHTCTHACVRARADTHTRG